MQKNSKPLKPDLFSDNKNGGNDLPLYLFHQGTNYSAYDFMGAHFTVRNGKNGVVFRVWAPKADRVSVVGDFNGWNADANIMERISDGGVFETFVENLYACHGLFPSEA